MIIAKNYSSTQAATKSVLTGSLLVATLLTILLVGYDTIILDHFRIRTVAGLGVVLYLLYARYLNRHKKENTSRWMIIVLYECLVFSVLTFWGLNTASGLLAVCFVIILPGVLLGSKYIPRVTISSILILVAVQTIHFLGIVQPQRQVLSAESTYWDVVAYATMFSIFALVAWLGQNQTERSLQRALTAEIKLKQQKAAVTAKLEYESATLRQTRLSHSHQLYQFALLGQSSAATMHELSNQLSILNLDIADLSQQNKNSKAIKNATETISQINSTVREARRQLHSPTPNERFLAAKVIENSINDISSKFEQGGVELRKEISKSASSSIVQGNPMALMQVVAILLNNALEACQGLESPLVQIQLKANKSAIRLSVIDSGRGIDEATRSNLFRPKFSSKPFGLGVGLYIAKHIVKTQLSGSIRLKRHELERGAHFVVTIPKATQQFAEVASKDLSHKPQLTHVPQ